MPGDRHDSRGWEESDAKAAVGGGYQGTGLVIPYRRQAGQAALPAWKERHNRSHERVRARIEHTFARMKGRKILRDCRLEGDGVHHAMPGIARLHDIVLAGQATRADCEHRPHVKPSVEGSPTAVVRRRFGGDQRDRAR